MAGEDKTEKATPKKRRDAREKEGNILMSKDVSTAVSVLGLFLALSLLGQFMFQMLLEMTKNSVQNVGVTYTPNSEFFMRTAFETVVYCVIILGPILLIAMFIEVIAVIAQTKGYFSMKPLKPKFSKLNPITGMKRLFSIQSVVGIVKGLIELIIIIFIVYGQIEARIVEIQKISDMEVMQGVIYTAKSIFEIVMIICIVLVFVAAADFVFQWWQYEKKLKMSKQEVKDEYKQIEGDPQIKSKIKQKQREMAQQRMMEEVPTADVIVRNPTHFAVALKYDTTANIAAAPRVIAKGQDALALKIIDIAEKNGVYIVENRPLARSLYEGVKVGLEIPPAFFKAVATIIAELYEQKPNKKNVNL